MSANVIESFFVALGFEIDTKELDEFSSKIEEAKDTVLGISKVAGIAAAAVGAFITKVGYGIDDLGDFAEAEQVAVDMVSEFGYAAQLSGSDLNAMKASISAVNKTVGEAVLGIGRGAMTFQKLGMSAKNADGSVKSFDQILEEVSDKMQGLSRQEAIAMAEKLGIDRSLIPMLLKGKEHIAALREEARAFGSVTEEDAEKAGLFADAMDRTHFMLAGLAKQIAVNLMPAMTGMLDGMRKWLLANREVVQSSITRAIQYVTAVLGTMWDWVVRLANGMSGLLKWLTSTTTGFVLLASAVALIAKAAAYQTFGMIASGIRLVAGALTVANSAALVTSALIGGIVIALALLIDDYVNWKEGNDSVIGGLIEQFPWLLDVIQSIQRGVGALVDFWLEQWNTLKGPLSDLGGSLWQLVSVLAEILWPVIKMIFTGWGYILAAVIPIIATLVGWIAEALVWAIAAVINSVAWLADAFVAVFNGIKTGIEFVVNIFETAKQKVMGFIDMVMGAIGKVGQLLGLTDDASNVKVAVNSSSNPSAQASSNNSVNAKGGVIGTAGSTSSSTSTVTQTTQISGTQIHISTPDAAKAGEAVSRELERMNRQTTRNGQSAVAL
jgi:hypothetical protein